MTQSRDTEHEPGDGELEPVDGGLEPGDGELEPVDGGLVPANKIIKSQDYESS